MKISVDSVDNYNQSKTNFFKLENDKDVAEVRFMYSTIDDVTLDVVHEVEVGDKKRYVSCLRSYDEPVDNCPLCKAGYKPQVKLFVPVYNTKLGEVQFWQRGKSFISQLSGLFSRYTPLVNTKFEIERNGKKGEQTTRYNIFPVGNEPVSFDDLPDIPNSMDSFVMTKSFDEMSNYVASGSFDSAVAEATIQRRPTTTSNRRPF